MHMAKLPRYSLFHNEKSKKWELKAEPSGKVVQRWTTKARATKGGVLKRAVKNLGSVRIRNRNGRIQEERTYPRSADPRGSKG
jgi:hypothetical protein